MNAHVDHCNHSCRPDANHSCGFICKYDGVGELLSERIKKIRTDAGDTPAAAALKLGISRQGYVKWESGDTENMKLGNLIAFCDKYHVDVAELITGRCADTQAKATTLQAAQVSPSYNAGGLSKEAISVAEYYDKLDAPIRAEFMASLVKAFLEMRLKNPEINVGDLGEIIDLARKI